MATFKLDLDPGMLPGHAGAAQALDRQADAGGGSRYGYPHAVFVRALGDALQGGPGEVAADLSEDQVYRVRDMIDDALAQVPPGSPPAVVLRAVIGQWDAFAGWDLAKANQRDSDNGLHQRSRTAVAARGDVVPAPAASSAPGLPEDGVSAAPVGGGGPAQEG
jgi:hypothetical protein